METLDVKDNYVMNKTQKSHCCPVWITPIGILYICRLEPGMLSKSMTNQVVVMTIEFKEN
ncbi:MAG: hypothetical protein QCH31_09485 [Methanolobus sp.]|nr:hypothetical protein [Methanolobus sp.]